MKDIQRHDISDAFWIKLESFLPGRDGVWGGRARDNRQFINGVFWILRTGAPWRDLPPCYGDWKNTHRRFIRWRDKGIWEEIMENLIGERDLTWVLLDATYIKAHMHAAGAVGGSQSLARTKGGSTQKYMQPWMRMACRSDLLLQMASQLTAQRLASLLMA